MSTPPTVAQPQDMNAAFAQAFNSGTLEPLMALYAPDAVHVGPESQDRGQHAIASGLQRLLALGGCMEAHNVYAVVSGETALLRGRWTLHLPDGSTIHGESAEVVQKQPDGSWLYLIDHPWGASQTG